MDGTNTASEDAMIVFDEVTFTYAGSEAPALTDVTLMIRRGEVVLVTGPSGSGKTTFCCCINALVPQHHDGELRGQVTVSGYDTRRARIGGLASIVGMVFQDPESQLVTASVADEVAFGPENLGVPRDEIEERVAAALEMTRLTGFEDREPFNLSGGEQQATVIAATHAMSPAVYVMDEPLANLDPAGRGRILSLLIDLVKQRGTTLVLVEHALDEVVLHHLGHCNLLPGGWVPTPRRRHGPTGPWWTCTRGMTNGCSRCPQAPGHDQRSSVL